MPCKKLLSVCKRAKADMRLLRQPEFTFEPRAKRLPVGRDVDLQGGTRCPQRVVKISLPSAPNFASCSEKPIHLVSISSLESAARTLVRQLGAVKLAREVRVEWNSRMQTGAVSPKAGEIVAAFVASASTTHCLPVLYFFLRAIWPG
jgi:hypothetical protein